jgi:hypothetical protein
VRGLWVREPAVLLLGVVAPPPPLLLPTPVVRVRKNPGFKKTQPSGFGFSVFFVFFLFFFGVWGFFWVFWGFFSILAQKRGFLRFFQFQEYF